MYAEWLSLVEAVKSHSANENVLRSFPPDVGREVVASVIRPLQDLVLGKVYKESPLCKPEQVQWTIQVVGYGLSLPLSELLLIQGCVDVYHDWLSSLHFRKNTVPAPILNNPNLYAQIIFDQLRSLFVPRENEPRLLEDHAYLCKKVIEFIHSLMAVKGLKMNRDTWSVLFTFVLHVCDMLLAPPSRSLSLGTALCESLVHLLFSSWLRACQDTFPSPNLWKTLREMCINWRHNPSLIIEWSQVMYSLTIKVISGLYGSKHLSQISPLPQENVEIQGFVREISYDTAVQCWFRMLHTLGNPTDLLYQEIIAGTPEFLKYSEISSGDVIPKCISQLPVIFRSLMIGISSQINLFLGHIVSPSEYRQFKTIQHQSSQVSRSPSVVRRRDKSVFFVPSPLASSKDTHYVNINSLARSPTNAPVSIEPGIEGIIGKTQGNTLLHIFGNWLFESSIWKGQDRDGFINKQDKNYTKLSISDITKATNIEYDSMIKDYEAGRAEAIGSLCAIFSHMPCGEEVLHIYLTRFYHSLSVGLTYDPKICTGQVLIRVLMTSVTLLRKDLVGINILTPHYLSAIETILPVDTPPFKCEMQISKLRKACGEILLSILPLPLHYVHLNIPDLHGLLQSVQTVHSSIPGHCQTFYSLKNRILKLLFVAMETETDPVNMQILIHALNVYFQDIITYESLVSKMISKESNMVEFEDREMSSSMDSSDVSLNAIFYQVALSAHNALKKWTASNTVSLAALELLSSLARLQFETLTHAHCYEAVQWVCDFIESQSKKKPHLQTKDLHTSIVAGFNTLMVWIMEHPHLLAHEMCLSSILRVTEFGMTGAFSKLEDGSVTYKEKKELRPISGRVGEMAEFLLYCIMEKFGSFPSPCGAAASGSLLTEDDLIKQLPATAKKPKFNYFLLNNSLILGLLEGSFITEKNTLPTVTGIIRGPASRQVWSIQLRHHPRSSKPSLSHLCSMSRPSYNDNPPGLPDLNRPPWPPLMNNGDELKLDKSIPSLIDVIDQTTAPLQREFSQLTEQQLMVESNIQSQSAQKKKDSPYPNPSTAIEPPDITKSFDTARLFLSHLGFLNIESLQTISSRCQSLVALDSSSLNFRSSLGALDRMNTRICDTVFVLYCCKGQYKVEDILANQISLQNKPQEFIHFLNGLGWTVDPLHHSGFAGKIHPDTSDGSSIGITAQIPLRPFSYYADTISEIAFVLPIQRTSTNDSTISVRSVESSDSGPDSSSFQSDSISYPTPQCVPTWSAPSGSGVCESPVQAGDALKPSRTSTNQSVGSTMSGGPEPSDTPKKRVTPPQDCATLVVWLECFEDHLSFPVESISKILHKSSGGHHVIKSERNSLPVIFVHRLTSGLHQVTTHYGNLHVGPLIDGMVVSKRSLSHLVRQTVTNLCMKHRLNHEGYSPPHVKRKRKIEEISATFARNLPIAQFYTELICNSYQ